ncbi:MAG: DUF3160 domain-containing protein [Pyrinomonadaceae bacterium]|nr:DUF3160 domain-containing protein [Pyrinomonadaceae bacterium]
MKNRKKLVSWIVTLIFATNTVAVFNQTASVKPYKVSDSLAEIENLKLFEAIYPLSNAKKAMLRKQLFTVSPTKTQQLFHIYEDNDYKDIPSFVTTDSVLQLYHIFFDFSLRTVEEKTLTPVLRRLSKGMLDQSVKNWKSVDEPRLKAAALKNVVYFAVAAENLGIETDVPAEASNMLRIELDLIKKHEGFAVGAIFPYQIDYSQFVPRGHYTKSETLTKFFKTMMWYGLAPFALESNEGRADETIMQSVLLTRALYDSGLNNEWESIYEPTAFYVGTADDVTPAEWNELSVKVYGRKPELEKYGSLMLLETFFKEAKKLRAARIQNKRLIEPGKTVAPVADIQFRFMGQRYIPDSEVLQRLSKPIKRPFPAGLDVMAVFGSDRARNHLDERPDLYNPFKWKDYGSERAKLVEQFAATPVSEWNSNLYWGWLDSLRTLLEPAPEGFPSFMRSRAWDDKSLNTALGSWAELRHDTILYGKQSGAEMGDGSEPAKFKGYVEPNVNFWDRLLKLTQQSREGLVSRKLMPDELKYKFDNFEVLLEDLKTISEKELRNEKLTESEYQTIRAIGGTLEYMTLSVMTGNPDSWELVNEGDRDMAVIADVHTAGNMVLEEGVGRANEILVIVPVEGKLMLTRGAVFSYYEFAHPANDRLTDSKWQEMLDSGKAPPPPAWTKSFVVEK